MHSLTMSPPLQVKSGLCFCTMAGWLSILQLRASVAGACSTSTYCGPGWRPCTCKEASTLEERRRRCSVVAHGELRLVLLLAASSSSARSTAASTQCRHWHKAHLLWCLKRCTERGRRCYQAALSSPSDERGGCVAACSAPARRALARPSGHAALAGRGRRQRQRPAGWRRRRAAGPGAGGAAAARRAAAGAAAGGRGGGWQLGGTQRRGCTLGNGEAAGGRRQGGARRRGDRGAVQHQQRLGGGSAGRLRG